MRVLMALPDKRARGGPPSHLYLLRDELAAMGVDVRSFLYGGRRHDENAIVKTLGRLWDLLVFPLLVMRHRPEVVHFNSAFDRKGVFRDAMFIPLARVLGAKVVVKFHGSDLVFLDSARGVWRRLIGLVLRWSNLICLLSGEEKTEFEKRYPDARFVMVKNALDFSRYETNGDFRAEHGIPASRPLLLFIARFIATKGLRETIEALPAIRERHDVHAVFVGDGPVRAECEALSRELGLSACTTFTGYIEEDLTVPAYRAADILVFPTYHQEGMPMVLFHSMACGLPIITTRIRAAADWMEEDRHGVFVPPRNPKAVAEAVIRLLDAPEMLAAMREAGRELARRFDKRAVAAEFRAHYQSL